MMFYVLKMVCYAPGWWLWACVGSYVAPSGAQALRLYRSTMTTYRGVPSQMAYNPLPPREVDCGTDMNCDSYVAISDSTSMEAQ